MSIRQRRISVGRASLAVDVASSGDPVVFLHAAVCDSRMWRAQMEAIAQTHQAITYDRRGFGLTTAEPEDHSAVTDLLAVLDAVGNSQPAILVACSQGGRVALDAALMHPGRIRALVLISPSVAGAPDPVYAPEVQALMDETKRATESGDLDRVNAIKARLFLDGALAQEGRVTGSVRELFLDMNGIALRSPPVGATIDNVSTFQRLREITAPALIICGTFDLPNIQDRCRHLATTMPQAAFQALPDAAHLPSLEQPAVITRLLTDFLIRQG